MITTQNIQAQTIEKMGVNVAKMSDESVQQNKRIEQAIKEDKRKNTTIFRLLLLGAGESGKSTVVKQMRILHTNGFTEEEIFQQRVYVYQNMLYSMAAIIRAMDKLGIDFTSATTQIDAAVILKAEENWLQTKAVVPREWQCLKQLWQDDGIQTCFKRSHEYHLCDSTKYFFDDINRISSANYVPSHDDILRARINTLGIVEISFPFRGLTLKVIDVGGQRSQRKKWIHCFDGVNSLIFIAALSEYNQTLFEDNSVNRLHEALKLFETVVNCQWFRSTPTILFLNKKDLFMQKLKSFPLKQCFADYQGSQQYEEAIIFIETQFQKRKAASSKQIYCHRTEATNTRNVEFVMAASFDIILSKNMREAGFT